jgi:hypothetical protein
MTDTRTGIKEATEAMMSISDRNGDSLYRADGEPMVTACRLGRPMPLCAYCSAESTRACDAPATVRRGSPWGRCGKRMCKAHAVRVGEHHHLCREHADGDPLATIKAGDTAANVFWEVIETKAVPIPGTSRPLTSDDRIAGVRDPDDEAGDRQQA